MRCFLPCAFAVLCIAIGHSAEQAARATINEHQERHAETICQLDPTACGERR